MNKISVVVPCYNEEEIIYDSYNSIKEVLEKIGKPYEIIIADDGSTDNSREILKRISDNDENFHAMLNEKNNGMGYVLRHMFDEANGDVVVHMDADLSVNPNIIKSFLEEIKNNDVVVGSRYCGIKGEIPFSRLIASRVYNLYIYILFGIRIRDTQTGFVAFRKNVLDSIKLTSNKFDYHIELFSKLKEKNFKIKEIPVNYIHRNQSKFNVLGDGIPTAFKTLKVWYNLKIRRK